MKQISPQLLAMKKSGGRRTEEQKQLYLKILAARQSLTEERWSRLQAKGQRG
ncbi:hypothetical protein [Nitrososphaera viennensis]|uniref:Uncharacterized protein n=2 Tax=Nitrososphaera viennensis TaxID=1034015 RepID=A0A060HPW1_9ARCH|nr:hypothetical protein [Nitrososphaera viennensis]AIC17170.1 hypothetical protein NVIE_028940 [Nitrososphaera viennensis EN76]UVS69060.1 hypothetical protein NWT39_14280 [Nitrososphaera viennensis]